MERDNSAWMYRRIDGDFEASVNASLRARSCNLVRETIDMCG